MPKKFKGENSKATEARERKAEVQRTKQEAVEKAKDDAYWADDHKQNAKKQQRKDDRDQKKAEEVKRKQELKAMADEELNQIAASSSTPSKKVTRHEIGQQAERRRKLEEDDKAKEELLKTRNIVAEAGDELPENVNRIVIEGESASTVEEAIQILDGTDTPVDRHPEKRQKAAYQAFEDKNLPRLKAENGNLRLSQLKQLLRKEWQKSPENPLNIFARK